MFTLVLHEDELFHCLIFVVHYKQHMHKLVAIYDKLTIRIKCLRTWIAYYDVNKKKSFWHLDPKFVKAPFEQGQRVGDEVVDLRLELLFAFDQLRVLLLLRRNVLLDVVPEGLRLQDNLNEAKKLKGVREVR